MREFKIFLRKFFFVTFYYVTKNFVSQFINFSSFDIIVYNVL